MSNIDKQALREAAKAAISAITRLNYAPDSAPTDVDVVCAYHALANPEAVLTLLDELEAREVRLNDINDYLAEVHDKTLNRAFRLLAEGVRAGDVSAIRHAGINVAAAGKGE